MAGDELHPEMHLEDLEEESQVVVDVDDDEEKDFLADEKEEPHKK